MWQSPEIYTLFKLLDNCSLQLTVLRLYDCVFLSCHIRAWSESALCNCFNINELLTRNRNAIWNLSDSNGMRTQNHLARKQTLNVFVYELSGCGLESRCSYLKFSYLNMEELWTGITFKKFPCYMHACSWRIGKNTRTFLTYVKRFWVIPCMKNCRNLIALCKKVFRNSPITFLQ